MTLQHVSLPRPNNNPLTGWIIFEAALPHHERRYGRMVLYQRPIDDEKARLMQLASEMEGDLAKKAKTDERILEIEWLTHKSAFIAP